MNQWPSQSQLEEARNAVMSEAIEQIRSFDLTSDVAVSRIRYLLIIADLLDHFCGN